MGFERLVALLQDVETNYDTDLFVPIFQTIEKVRKKNKIYYLNYNLIQVFIIH